MTVKRIDYWHIFFKLTDALQCGNSMYVVNKHLFEEFDPNFAGKVEEGDVVIGGENFGCGSSREHPSVGLAHAGVKAVIVKSVNRIFFRSAVNQGLPVIVHPEAVSAYKSGDFVMVDFPAGKIRVGDKTYTFQPLPDKLMEIIEKKGLVNWIAAQ